MVQNLLAFLVAASEAPDECGQACEHWPGKDPRWDFAAGSRDEWQLEKLGCGSPPGLG